MEKRYLLESERKIRLTNYDKQRLYSKLLGESGLREVEKDSIDRLTDYCEKLARKYILGEELNSICPGCYRISKLTSTVNILFKEDFDIDVPKIELVSELNDYIIVEFKNKLPNIFNEGTIWSRHGKNFPTDSRFSTKIKKLASDVEIKTLVNLLHEVLNAKVIRKSFLKELRTPARSVYRGYDEFGKFFNLGALYDYSKEFGLVMKYDILLLSDPEDEENKKKIQTFDKNPRDFSTDQNIERLKLLLGF